MTNWTLVILASASAGWGCLGYVQDHPVLYALTSDEKCLIIFPLTGSDVILASLSGLQQLHLVYLQVGEAFHCWQVAVRGPSWQSTWPAGLASAYAGLWCDPCPHPPSRAGHITSSRPWRLPTSTPWTASWTPSVSTSTSVQQKNKHSVISACKNVAS